MLDKYIGATKIYGCLLQFLKETGAHPGEALSMTPAEIDFDKRIVTISKLVRRCRFRQSKVSNKLITMLMPLLHSKCLKERIWKIDYPTVKKAVYRAR